MEEYSKFRVNVSKNRFIRTSIGSGKIFICTFELLKLNMGFKFEFVKIFCETCMFRVTIFIFNYKLKTETPNTNREELRFDCNHSILIPITQSNHHSLYSYLFESTL